MEIERCDCGIMITGKDVNSLKSNMVQHLNSKYHKRQMELIKLKEKEISQPEKSPTQKVAKFTARDKLQDDK